MDWDEELKRQAAISSLLEPPETGSDSLSQIIAQPPPEVSASKADDWHKWDTVSPQEDTTVYPTIAEDQGSKLLTDKDTSTRFVMDPETRQPVPHAELATEADKAAQPAGTGMPQVDVTGQTPVKRAELIDPDPDLLYADEAPRAQPVPVPSVIAGSDNAILNPAAGVTPPSKYPDQIVKPEEASGATSLVNAPPAAAPVKTAGGASTLAAVDQTGAQPAVKPVADNWKTWTTEDGTPAGGAEIAEKGKPSDASGYANPDGTPFPEATMAVGDQQPKAFIVHHTSGRGTVQGVVDTLNQRGLGVEYVMDRDGNIFQTGGPGAQNIKTGWGAGAGLNNSNVVGMEIIANNDKDVTDAQKNSFAKFIAQKYPNTPLYGHGEVNPGHKEANEGQSAKAAAEALRAGQQPASTEEPPINTLVALDSSGLNVTHFGYKSDPNLDPDSAKGAGKYVEQMIPGYDVALNAKAAALVGNPKPGDTFEYAGREWRYGDKVPEKYSDARFDIYDQDGTALTGGMPVGKTLAAAPSETPVQKQDWESWQTVPDQHQTDAEIKKQYSVLDNLNQTTPNRGQFWKMLNAGPITGVSPSALQDYKDQVKKQITDYAVDYYKPGNPKITPDQAFKMATGDANFGTFAGEIASKIIPNLTKTAITLEQSQGTIDENRAMTFLKTLVPGVAPDKLVAAKREMLAMTPQERAIHINELISQSGQQFPGMDPTTIADSFDRLADPVYQAKRKASLDTAVAQNKRDLSTDPRLANTPAEAVTGWLSSAPKNVSEMLSGPVGWSMMHSEIYTDTLASIKKDNPSLSDDEAQSKALGSTVAQMGPQVVIGMMTGGALSAATRGITQPLLELGARLGLHSTVAGIAGGVQKFAQNAAEGKPLMDGVQDAVIANAPYGLLGGAMAGRTAIEPRGIPIDTGVEHGPPIESVPTDTGVTHGPEEFRQPVHVEQEVPGAPPTPPRPWYMQPDPAGTEDPLVVRGQERTTFTPSELADRMSRIPSGTPERVQRMAEELTPASWFLNSDQSQQAEINLAQRAQAGQAPPPAPRVPMTEAKVQSINNNEPHIYAVDPQGTEKKAIIWQHDDGTYRVMMPQGGMAEPNKVYATREEAQAAARDAFQKNGWKISLDPAAIPGSGGVTGGAGVKDPWVSEIANRFVRDRVARGELGAVEPGTGLSTEELLARGMKMGPEEINQHMSDINNRVGDPVKQTAAMRAEEARLSHRSHQTSLAYENEATEQNRIAADNAFKDLTDFHNGPMKRLKENWHRQGVAMQDRIPIDISTYNGIRAEWIRNSGKTEIRASAEAPMRKAARRVRDGNEAQKRALQKLKDATESDSRMLPSEDKVRQEIMEIMGNDPCAT